MKFATWYYTLISCTFLLFSCRSVENEFLNQPAISNMPSIEREAFTTSDEVSEEPIKPAPIEKKPVLIEKKETNSSTLLEQNKAKVLPENQAEESVNMVLDSNPKVNPEFDLDSILKKYSKPKKVVDFEITGETATRILKTEPSIESVEAELQGNQVTLDLIVLASGFVSDISVVKCEKEVLKEKAINFTKGLVFNKISRDIRQHGRIKMLFVVDQDES